jgi:hypothetical protein
MESKRKKLGTTMGIKHRADSGFRKLSVLNQVRFGRTVNCFEMPYVSYPSRCATTEEGMFEVLQAPLLPLLAGQALCPHLAAHFIEFGQ